MNEQNHIGRRKCERLLTKTSRTTSNHLRERKHSEMWKRTRDRLVEQKSSTNRRRTLQFTWSLLYDHEVISNESSRSGSIKSPCDNRGQRVRGWNVHDGIRNDLKVSKVCWMSMCCRCNDPQDNALSHGMSSEALGNVSDPNKKLIIRIPFDNLKEFWHFLFIDKAIQESHT